MAREDREAQHGLREIFHTLGVKYPALKTPEQQERLAAELQRQAEEDTACFECTAPAEYAHHVIPRSHGGTQTIPLCTQCHERVHERPFNISALTSAALAAKRVKGERLGQVPYGFRVAADGKTLVPDATEQTLLDAIATLDQQGLTLRAIVLVMAQQGFTSRKGTPLGLTQIARIVRQSQRSHPSDERT